MLLKVITNTLKKVLFSDDKNTQHVHNICCSWIKIDLRCNFIVMILTRTGLHIFDRTSKIWHALVADLELSVTCSLSSFKAVLYGYYKQDLVASNIPDDPRSFKSICSTFNAAHSLGRNITCCFYIFR